MAVAKLGDYLGINMWETQTKYKATIKTALDYLVTLDPGQEDPGAALPLVAAAMAAYGDDGQGSYKKFLEAGGAQGRDDAKSKPYPYQSKTWWFYEQPDALGHSPSRNKRDVDDSESIHLFDGIHQDVLGARSASLEPANSTPTMTPQNRTDATPDTTTLQATSGETVSSSVQSISDFPDDDDYYPSYDGPVILHPDRPAPFMSTDAVELDEGIFVYWEQIRHLYEDATSRRRSKWARW